MAYTTLSYIDIVVHSMHQQQKQNLNKISDGGQFFVYSYHLPFDMVFAVFCLDELKKQ